MTPVSQADVVALRFPERRGRLALLARLYVPAIPAGSVRGRGDEQVVRGVVRYEG